VGRRSWRPDIFWAVLLALPLLVLIPDDSVNYSLPGYIDPWLYFGYFTHLKEFKEFLFPPTYYGSRLGWLLPGAAIYHLIPSYLMANCVLHLTVYYTALFSLYSSLKQTFGGQNAIIPSVLFGLYPYFWGAVGWDYPNGAGIAYFLLSTAFITRAIRQAKPLWSLAAAGAAGAAMVYTNLTWVIFLPFFPVYYMALRYPSAKQKLWVTIRDFVIWFTAGALALTLLFCCIDYFLDGEFQFYLPSIRFVMEHGNKLTPGQVDAFTWMKNARWLIAEGAVFLLAALFLLRYYTRPKTVEDRPAAVLSAIFLCTLGALVYLGTRGQFFLHIPYYGAFMLPVTFLTIGGYIRIPENWAGGKIAAVTVAAVALIAVPWLSIGHKVVRGFLALGPTLSLWVAVGALAMMIVWRGRTVGVAGGIAGMFGLTAYAIGPGGPPNPGAARAAFIRITRSMDAIDQIRKEQPLGVWYDSEDQNQYEFSSIGYSFIYSGIGNRFPAMPTSPVSPGMIVVVPSSREDAGAIAERSFHPEPLILRPLSRVPISYGSVRYSLFFFQVGIDPRVLQPATVSAASGQCCEIRGATDLDPHPFPLGEWRLIGTSDDPSDMEQHSGKPQFTTPKHRDAYVAAYPVLVVQEPGIYRFVLRYRPLAGEITFGGRNSDGTLWSPAGPAVLQGPFRVKQCFITVKKGDTLQLLIANGRDTVGASRFEIEELTAYKDHP
jgi:hypothetical protein